MWDCSTYTKDHVQMDRSTYQDLGHTIAAPAASIPPEPNKANEIVEDHRGLERVEDQKTNNEKKIGGSKTKRDQNDLGDFARPAWPPPACPNELAKLEHRPYPFSGFLTSPCAAPRASWQPPCGLSPQLLTRTELSWFSSKALQIPTVLSVASSALVSGHKIDFPLLLFFRQDTGPSEI